ncbi:FAD-dependent oxidoreductase [Streptomyces sp. H27-D2]|uniref:FAD-dependent oxidoreductase n=1 Tax=Streptomyces sp. H27-D2 TaxID=3046304 RepID=UPI002DBBC241|nr:FAD-dependent oxidoreductase [Streptomyces sp. H27-D2]MEC4017354.1 FAD-dependent oxidoreductase [Streptomyces sp. H27-D2]
MSFTSPQVVVVGAGPAGLNAALAAADSGAAVVLVDSAARTGGQYYRQSPAEFAEFADAAGAAEPDRAAAGIARVAGGKRHVRRGPAEAVRLERRVAVHPRIEYLPRTTVWAVEPGRPAPPPPRAPAAATDRASDPHVIHLVHIQQGPADGVGRAPRTLAAAALVLCPGAYDRALPFPGWDLPGVVTAGAAQALAKGQRIAVGRRVVVSGTGPFLLPVASSLLGVGARVRGVYEAGSPSGWLRAPLTALRDGRTKLPELAAHTARMARHRVPYRTRHAVVAAHGRDRVEAVTVARLDPDWRIRPGTERRIEGIDALCIGYGFTPQLELAVAAGCELGSDPDGGGYVIVNPWQGTSTPGVYAAGEITGIGGAELAAAEGVLAGIAAAVRLGCHAEAERAHAARRRVRTGRRFAAALAAAHPVRSGWQSWLSDDTLVCRCEEVPYRDLRAAVQGRGADGTRALKLTSRAGLGACQGRVCGRNTAELAAGLAAGLAAAGPGRATEPGGPPHSPGPPDPYALDRRPIAQPIRLGDLAVTGPLGDQGDQPGPPEQEAPVRTAPDTPAPEAPEAPEASKHPETPDSHAPPEEGT